MILNSSSSSGRLPLLSLCFYFHKLNSCCLPLSLRPPLLLLPPSLLSPPILLLLRPILLSHPIAYYPVVTTTVSPLIPLLSVHCYHYCQSVDTTTVSPLLPLLSAHCYHYCQSTVTTTVSPLLPLLSAHCYHYCQSVDTTTVSPHVPCNSVYLSATFSSPFARSLGILFPNTPASFMTFPATSGCLVNTGMNQVLWL